MPVPRPGPFRPLCGIWGHLHKDWISVHSARQPRRPPGSETDSHQWLAPLHLIVAAFQRRGRQRSHHWPPSKWRPAMKPNLCRLPQWVPPSYPQPLYPRHPQGCGFLKERKHPRPEPSLWRGGGLESGGRSMLSEGGSSLPPHIGHLREPLPAPRHHHHHL